MTWMWLREMGQEFDARALQLSDCKPRDRVTIGNGSIRGPRHRLHKCYVVDSRDSERVLMPSQEYALMV